MAQWLPTFEDVACNGDVVVRSAKGRLVALIYAVNPQPRDPATMTRAKAFIAAAQPTWCDTCGKDTVGTSCCGTCALFWLEHANDEKLCLGLDTARLAAEASDNEENGDG